MPDVLLWAGRPALKPFVLLVLLWDLLSCRMYCFEEFWNFHDFKTFCPALGPFVLPNVLIWIIFMTLKLFVSVIVLLWEIFRSLDLFFLLNVLFLEASISFVPFVMLTCNISIRRDIFVKNQTHKLVCHVKSKLVFEIHF